jgi:hypothetical protein
MILLVKSFVNMQREHPSGWGYHILRPVYAVANIPAGYNG